MNTKFIISASAIVLVLCGILLIFLPDLILETLEFTPTPMSQILVQITGGLYFGFGMLNWMTRERPTGGIYNRPVVIANLSHFIIGGLTTLKYTISAQDVLALVIWICVFYLLLAIVFSFLLFKSPSSQ